MYVGRGRNGKSVWFKILNELYGSDNVTHHSIHNIERNRFAPASLDGKFCNIHADISAQEITYTGIMKQLIGGDAIEAEHKGRPHFTMREPHPIMFFSANQIPEVEDLSDAWMRRWEYTDWKQEFDVKDEGKSADRQLTQKLTTKEELEGLLLTLINAARNIQQTQRLTRERTVNEVREEWIKRSDVTLAFLQATIQPDPDGFIPKDQLLGKYLEYCKAKDYSPKPPRLVWKKLRDNYTTVQDYKPKIEGERTPCWKGIKLTNPQSTLP
jgi:putative DNA primase/helicase